MKAARRGLDGIGHRSWIWIGTRTATWTGCTWLAKSVQATIELGTARADHVIFVFIQIERIRQWHIAVNAGEEGSRNRITFHGNSCINYLRPSGHSVTRHMPSRGGSTSDLEGTSLVDSGA